MSSGSLTDSRIRSLKPQLSQYETIDRGQRGLSLRISPAGTKAWYLLTRIRGVKRRIKIGTYPEITLTAAREEARRQLAQIQLGSDIWSEKKGSSNQVKFEVFAERYLTEWASQKADQGHEDRRKIKKHLLSHWGKLNIDEITKRHVHNVLDEIMQGEAFTMPNRVLQLIKTMFNWGVEKDFLSVNPAAHIRKPRKEQARDAYLHENEIKKLWGALDHSPILFGNFFKLCILMGQRSGSEMRHLKWSEIDFKQKTANISFERMKNRISQEVPLSDFAINLLLEQKKMSGESPFVFPSPVNPLTASMSYPRKRFARIKKQSTIDKDFHAHDFRHTISTLMASRLKVPKVVIEKIISHKTSKNVSEIYDQHDYFDEKRDALERWGQFIQRVINVSE